MAYTKNPTWVDGVGNTLITAAALNHIEDGLLDAAADADAASVDTTPDASTTVKGKVQLAGDLAGTAGAPTVPGLAGKAATVHTHISTDVTDFAESVDDRVAALVKAGANVTVTYDDTAGTLTIASTASGGGASALLQQIPRVGEFLNATDIVTWATGAGDVSGNSGAMSVPVPQAITIDALQFNVQAGAAGSTCRVGIYGPTTFGLPGTLLREASAATDTSGYKTATISPLALTPGNYWLVVRASTATGLTLRRGTQATRNTVLHQIPGSTNYAMMADFGTSAALTATISTIGGGNSTDVAIVGMRRSA